MQVRQILIRGAIAMPIVALGIFVARGWGSPSETTDGEILRTVPIVRIAYAQEPVTVRTVRYPGVVSGSDEAYLGALVGGRVAEVPVEAGDPVKSGDLLVSIDAEGYQLAADEAEADRNRADVQLAQARRDLARVEALGDAATQEELEQRRAAVDAAEAQRARAVSGVSDARRRLRETAVRTLRDGVVTQVLVERGEIVAEGTPVAVVSPREETREIELRLPYSEMIGLEAGEYARVRNDLGNGEAYDARIVAISAHGRSMDALFPVRLELPAEASLVFPPGTPVSVELRIREQFGNARVPAAAVSGVAAGEAFSYRVDDDRAVRIALTRVRNGGDGFLLAEGPVTPGDALIVSGQDNIADGGVVEVTQ